ncbi:MAG TPA: MoxR family ATPase [Chitinophagaceae bacterium]|jgi:MoxR-like ATPase|nr:MoxR family ATPase [Chitinophagaceae bacterium]
MKEYTGKGLLDLEQSKPYKVAPYIPSANLIEAVNLAMVLRRPLLLKGEPGCGKSRLAEAVAAELFGTDFRKYFFPWNVKSTSKAQDGLYVIDNLQRLQDANFDGGDNDGDNDSNNDNNSDSDSDNSDGNSGKLRITLDKENGKYLNKGKYIELGVLGQAFQLSQDLPADSPPPVILIDEIDKADIDFPNDLLLELDKMEFEIPEIKENGKALRISANENLKPLFIVTSNDEKPLPPAFLRRCLFYYIDFLEIPVTRIVSSNYPDLEIKLIDDSVAKFVEWRDKIEKRGSSNKKISTSELLDWMKLIAFYNKQKDPRTNNFIENNLPVYYQSLLKDVETIQLFQKKDPADISS